MISPDSILQSRDITLLTKICTVKAMVFSVVMYGCERGTGWAPKNWSFGTVMLEKTLESPLDYREIKLVNPNGNQPWISPGWTDTEAVAPIFWPPDAKSRLIGKDPDAGRDGRQKEKAAAEDEMVEWHHHLNGHEWMCSWCWWWTGRPDVLQPMGCREWDMIEWRNWTELSMWVIFIIQLAF